MADQIIIELIGDPSGLKPAEDALKELSKISKENMEAFNKANESMKKFQEGLGEAAKKAKEATEASKKLAESLKDIGKQADAIKKTATAIDDIGKKASAATEASKKIAEGMKGIGQQAESVKKTTTAIDGIGTTATKSITAISGLNGAIASGAVKEATKNYYGLSDAAKGLITEKVKLMQNLDDERARLKTLTDQGINSGKAYDDQRAAVSKFVGSTSSLTTKLEKLGFSHAQVSNDAFRAGAAQKLLGEQMTGSAKATTDAGSSTEKSSGKINIFSKAIETGREKLSGFTKKMQENAKGAADNSKKVGDLIGHTKGMVSALGEVGQAMASANGNEAAGAEIKKKTAAALQALSTAQAVVTVATEAATIATTAATIANIALDAAMFPITLTVAAIALAVGALYLAFQKLTVVKEMFAPIGAVIDVVSDKMRDFLSLISFGLVDSAAVHKHKEDIKQLGDEHEKNSEKLKKQIDLLEAQGASTDKIWAAKKQQLEEEQVALALQIGLEEDAEKKKELQNKLDQNALALAKNKNEEAEAHLATMKEEGASEEEILKYKKEQNDKALEQNNAALEKLKLDMQDAQTNGTITAEMEEQLQTLEHQNKVLNTQHKEIMQGVDEQQKKKDDKIKEGQDKAKDAHAKALEDAKNTADARLSMAVAGSKEELDAKIADINAAAAVEMNNAKGNAAQVEAIRKKSLQDIAAAENTYNIKNLEDAKTGVEAQLLLVKKGSQDELNLKAQLATQERDIALSQAGLTANQKLLIENQYQKKVEDLNKQAEHDAAQARINARKTEIQMALQEKKISIDAKLKLDKESLQIEQNERIAAIKASGKSELEIEKEIKLAEMNYDASVLATEKAAAKAHIDETLKAELEKLETEKSAKKLSHKEMEENFMKGINARKAAIEEMHKKGIIDDAEYNKQIKAANDDTTKHNADNAKKQQDLAKKLGQEAINLAKQVADAIFAAQAEKRKQALDDAINTLEAQKSAELSNHHLTAAQKTAIEKKYHAQEAAAKEKAWKADQKAKAEQAIINGLLAFTMSMAQQGFPAGLVTGLLALAQAGVVVGTILSKSPPKFAKGVIGLEGPGTETSDSISAYLSKGESVITAERTKQYKPILEQIQAGVYTPLPIPMLSTMPRLTDISKYLSQTPASGSSMDYDKLGRAVAKNIPAPVINNIRMDEQGFSKSIIKNGNRTEYYNSKMKF